MLENSPFFKEHLFVIQENAKSVRNTYITYLSLAAFIWLTVESTTHLQLFNPSERLTLPLIGIELPIVRFFVIAPLLLLLFHTYFMIHVTQFAELLHKTREKQSSAPKDWQAQINGSLFCWYFLGSRSNDKALIFLVESFVFLSFWCIVPIIILRTQWLFLPYHHVFITALHHGCLQVSLAIACYYYYYIYKLKQKKVKSTAVNLRVFVSLVSAIFIWLALNLFEIDGTLDFLLIFVALATFFYSSFLFQKTFSCSETETKIPEKESTNQILYTLLILSGTSIVISPFVFDQLIKYYSFFISVLIFAAAMYLTENYTWLKWLANPRKWLTQQTSFISFNLVLLATALISIFSWTVLTIPKNLIENDAEFTWYQKPYELIFKFINKDLEGNQKLRISTAIVRNITLPGASLTPNSKKSLTTTINNTTRFFEKLDLKARDLRYANFAGADLSGAVFRGADISHANFTNAKLENTDFSNLNINGGCEARSKNIKSCQSTKASGANFSLALLKQAVFKNSQLDGTIFNGANLDDANFENAQLHKTTFDNVWIYKFYSQQNRTTLFPRGDFKPDLKGLKSTSAINANFSRSAGQNNSFKGGNFKNAVFTGAKIPNSDFSNANLSGADLLQTNLQYSTFSETQLQGADLTEANLTGADFFHNANLQGAVLRETNLFGAGLGKADFTGADLSLANLDATTLRDTIFRGVDFQNASLKSSQFGVGTIFNTVNFLNTAFGVLPLGHDIVCKTLEGSMACKNSLKKKDSNKDGVIRKTPFGLNRNYDDLLNEEDSGNKNAMVHYILEKVYLSIPIESRVLDLLDYSHELFSLRFKDPQKILDSLINSLNKKARYTYFLFGTNANIVHNNSFLYKKVIKDKDASMGYKLQNLPSIDLETFRNERKSLYKNIMCKYPAIISRRKIVIERFIREKKERDNKKPKYQKKNFSEQITPEELSKLIFEPQELIDTVNDMCDDKIELAIISPEILRGSKFDQKLP